LQSQFLNDAFLKFSWQNLDLAPLCTGSSHLFVFFTNHAHAYNRAF